MSGQGVSASQTRRLASFAEEGAGGNPAGVAFCDPTPPAETMLRVAAEIGYSETAFLTPDGLDGAGRARWRVRYFAPQMEVPFCGHATIAAGAALGESYGAGVYALRLNDGEISVTAEQGANGAWRATLTSPPTRSAPAAASLVDPFLTLFGLSDADLDPDWPPSLAEAGARHLVLALKDRAALTALGAEGPLAYPLTAAKTAMDAEGLVTIAFVYPESERLFHVRNAFASGGVAEDPATGAAAAAFAGLLRDLGRLPSDGRFEILQGADMGAPSRIRVSATQAIGAPILVSGAVREISG